MRIVLFFALAAACKPGQGDRCFCAGECRKGLVCAVDGAVLPKGSCVEDVTRNREAGSCIQADEANEYNEGGFPPVFFDLGTRRDLGNDDGATGPSETGTSSGGPAQNSTSDAATTSATATTASTHATTSSGSTGGLTTTSAASTTSGAPSSTGTSGGATTGG